MITITDELIDLAQQIQALDEGARRRVYALCEMHRRDPLRSDALARRWARGHITTEQLGDECVRWAEGGHIA